MAKDLRTSLVYQHTTAKKTGTRSTLEVKICRGRIILAWLTAWIDCFCLFCFYMFELLLLIQKMTCFLSNKRKSQIVATIGTLLDEIHV